MSGETIHYRCLYGKPCTEVVDRLVAADKSEHAGQQDAADELRKQASRWALIHNYGNPPEAA